jgi:molybdopterin synthase catalytic subunit
MDINKMIDKLKMHPDFSRMGMIASHLGIVRGTSLNGREVKEIEVEFHQDKIHKIAKDAKQLPGIIEVLIETFGGRLKVGDEIMFVAVGGDIRDHVFPALVETVNRIKKEGTSKKEIF